MGFNSGFKGLMIYTPHQILLGRSNLEWVRRVM